MAELIKHYTDQGHRYGVVVHRGRKWMKIHYVAHPRPTRMGIDEERYIVAVGTMTRKQVARFNQSVVAHGGGRGAI